MDALKLIAQDSVKTEIPQFEVGDTIRIDVNIREGDRERIQVFEGTVIARKGSGHLRNVYGSPRFLWRRRGESVPAAFPNVKGIKIVREGRVRRAKLYFLRDRVGKAAKVKEQIR